MARAWSDARGGASGARGCWVRLCRTESRGDAERGWDGLESEHVGVLEKDEVRQSFGLEAGKQAGLMQQGVHLREGRGPGEEGG